ncbi:hypothetical protein PM082_001320 [Marasmius tenuissimus]|nr:hypothetical protein PM082_001320 [Marasmius tenuissimus]
MTYSVYSTRGHNRPPSSGAQSNSPCTLHTPLNTITSASELCTLLAGKRVLLVGPETTFHLHMNWLRDHELYENRSHRCSGPEYCNSHQICLPPVTAEETKGGAKKTASTRELEETRSASLRYVLSNTLYAKGPSDDVKYTSPLAQVDTFSGVRLRDSYWLGQAKKSDVLILNRGPLPAPSQTYDGTSTGNWTFLEDALYSLNYMEKKTQYGSIVDVLPNDRDNMEHRLVVAALYVTFNTFLPSTLETVRTLRSDRATRDKVLVWHGSWFIPPSCLSPLGTEINRPEDALFETLGSRDHWLLYHNAQGDAHFHELAISHNHTDLPCPVYMQNYLLRSLLPQYDVSFIPQAGPSYHIDRRETVDNAIDRRECLRYTHGSPMEEAMRFTLLTGVSRVVEAL